MALSVRMRFGWSTLTPTRRPIALALVFPAGEGPSQLAMGDVNNDGRPDVVVTTAGLSNTISILLANGDGTFESPRQFRLVHSDMRPWDPSFQRSVAT
jgi:hypothetical protein